MSQGIVEKHLLALIYIVQTPWPGHREGKVKVSGHGRMCLDSASLLRLMISAAMAMF